MTPAPTSTTPTTTSTTTTADADEPMVDPTLPSWAPGSCRGYHAAVVRALDCDALDQTKRAQIRAQYDVDHAKWDTMHDQPLDAIAKVGVECKSSREAVRMTSDAKCPATTSTR